MIALFLFYVYTDMERRRFDEDSRIEIPEVFLNRNRFG